MRLFKICTKSEYVDPKDGQQKHKWYWAGTLRITDSGSMFMRRHDNPDVQYYFFEQEFPVSETTSDEVETITSNTDAIR